MPANLTPSLLAARDDVPRTLSDGCHVNQPGTTIPDCVYGQKESATTVVLLGDSHANQWFPAIEWLGKERGVARRFAHQERLHTGVCDGLERGYEARLYRVRPVARERLPADREGASGPRDRGQQPLAQARRHRRAVRDTGGRSLQLALETTLTRLQGLAGAVVLMGDTPFFDDDPPERLSEHLDDVLACAQPRSRVTSPAWTSLEREAASRTGASYVDTIRRACPSEPCPVVIGRYLAFRDRHHLSTPFVLALRTDRGAGRPPTQKDGSFAARRQGSSAVIAGSEHRQLNGYKVLRAERVLCSSRLRRTGPGRRQRRRFSAGASRLFERP